MSTQGALLWHSVMMFSARPVRRWWWLVVFTMALVAGLAVLWVKPALERAIRSRIESEAARHGAVARIGRVRIGVSPLLTLERVDLDLRHGMSLHCDTVAATWPGRLQVALHAAILTGPAEVKVSSAASVWNVAGRSGDDFTLALVEPKGGLSIHRRKDRAGSEMSFDAHELDVGHFLDVRRDDRPLLDGGVIEGHLKFRGSAEAVRLGVDLKARGARLGVLADNATDEPQLGDPTDATIRFDGTWQEGTGTVEVPDIHATVAGAAVSGSVALHDLDDDPEVDLALAVQQLDFAQLLAASGLAIPESLGMTHSQAGDLGYATIDLRVRGRLAEPASLSVTQKIAFQPPHEMPPGIARLRSDFVFRSEDGAIPHSPISVSPASPDFIALRDVPPLFVRTLLISEDAGFYGHRGIDLRELPTALLTNWSRGAAARGASTITQQLAKNLFLSRNKELGRKLQELAVTFLLESALGKNRILEIYLNIIEWGPELRGLRPAARRYFDRDPQALTPAEMAFLVVIIPGPIKYQSSFAHGTPGPGLRSLVDTLLAKLRSVGAISEEEYRKAVDEEIRVIGRQSSS